MAALDITQRRRGKHPGLCWGAGYEVGNHDLSIPESAEDVSELDLLWILASLTHNLIQNNSLLEGLVGSSPLVRELSVRVSGVKTMVQD